MLSSWFKYNSIFCKPKDNTRAFDAQSKNAQTNTIDQKDSHTFAKSQEKEVVQPATTKNKLFLYIVLSKQQQKPKKQTPQQTQLKKYGTRTCNFLAYEGKNILDASIAKTSAQPKTFLEELPLH